MGRATEAKDDVLKGELLIAMVSNFANFSERALIGQRNQSVLEIGALAIDRIAERVARQLRQLR
jgi:hypothetical protein